MKSFLEYTQEVGLCLCTKGAQTMLINGKKYVQRSGVLSIKSPIFVFQTLSQSEDFEACTVFADVSTIFPILRASLDIVKDFRILEHPCMELSPEITHYIILRARELKERRSQLEQRMNPAERFLLSQSIKLYVQQTFAEFLLMYYRENPVTTSATDRNGPLVFQFAFSLHQNYREHRTVQFYADEAHLSTGHFSSLVKSVLGCTPSEMIAFITISNIKLMLRQTNKSIKEIADYMNFPEQFTFRKYFKQHTGMSPKEYRLNLSLFP